MTENIVKVRAKPLEPHRSRISRPVVAMLALFGVGLATYISYGLLAAKFNAFNAPPIEIESPAGKIIKVPAGGDLQAAIEGAAGGDIIELQAGASYSGVKLPAKPLADFVTIRSSGFDSVPVDTRVGPANASAMAKIVARGEGSSAVTAENGANHFRFVGIEFTSDGKGYVYNLILFGSEETSTAKVPHDLEIDRCWVHTGPTGIIRRGLALNSAATIVKNSYFEGFAFPEQETQGIAGWTGTKDVKILNNYIEAGAENVLFGGADPSTAELIPSGIEIRGNHLNKPAGWAHGVTAKTLFELKNSRRVEFVGNLLTNNFHGSALRITVRNQDGKAPFSTIEDVSIRDNVIDRAGEGINILGKDDTYPSQTLKRLTIQNNLFLHIANAGDFEGSGYFVQVADGEDITIANNTVFNSGNLASFYGTVPRRFVFRDNVVNHGNYGVHGLDDLKSAAARAMFSGNIVMNLNNVGSGDTAIPPGSAFVPGMREVGFRDPSQNDYRLAAGSRFKGKGTGGSDPGVSDLSPALLQQIKSN